MILISFDMQFIWNKKNCFLLVILLTGCQSPLTEWTEEREIESIKNHPYIQFKQEIAFLEPLIETSAITAKSKNIKQDINNTGINLPMVQPLNLEGNLEIAGSTGVFPLNQLIYDRFVRQGFASLINFNTIGTNKSIKLFCQEQKFDLLTLSRAMKEAEIATCRKNNIEPINFAIAKDAVVIVVNSQNNFVNKVSSSMLTAMLTKGKWSDIDPNWPNQPINRFIISPSASLDLVGEKILGGNRSSLLNAPNTTLYQDEALMIQRLNTDIYGIGFLSNPVFDKASKSLKSLVIDGTTPQSIKVNKKTYPLERSLYIYADRNQLKQKPNLSSFINFYLTNVNEEIEEAKLFPISSEELDKSKIKWLRVMGY